MQKDEQTADESEIASMKKDINDALGANYYDCMQALDSRFTELRLGTPERENYALIRMPQSGYRRRYGIAMTWSTRMMTTWK